MPIEANCTNCNQQYRVADKFAGKTIKCPKCQAPVKLPGGAVPPVAAAPPPAAAPSMPPSATPPPAVADAETPSEKATAKCSGCHSTIRLPAKYAGKRVKCPKCGGAVLVPAIPAPPAIPPAAAPPPPQPAPPANDFPGINTGNERPTEFDFGGPAPPAPGAEPSHQPVLRATGKKKSMANMAVGGDLKKTGRGNSIANSMIYQVGEARSFWDRVKAGTHVGPFVKEMEIEVDQIHVMTIADRSGEFHMLIPYDNGQFCPIEFLSVMPGQLPASMGLLRGQGGNWGIEASNSAAGVFLPQAMRSVMTAMGGQAESAWVVLDESQPQTAAEVANRSAALRNDLRFDAKLNMGPMELTYHIDWIAQALPLDASQYLLVAQFIPQKKMLGVGLGASWFVPWREQFRGMASGLPAGNGGFHCYDYGNWGTVADEVLRLKVF